jgi:hypothetical protein
MSGTFHIPCSYFNSSRKFGDGMQYTEAQIHTEKGKDVNTGTSSINVFNKDDWQNCMQEPQQCRISLLQGIQQEFKV